MLSHEDVLALIEANRQGFQDLIDSIKDEDTQNRINDILLKIDEPPKDGETFSTWEATEKEVGPLEWIWPNWWPAGFLTMLAAEQEKGKSVLALWLSYLLITGSNFPDGQPSPFGPGQMLWLETEAGQGLNLLRAKMWDIPLKRLLNPHADPFQQVNIDSETDQQHVAQLLEMDHVRGFVLDSFQGATQRNTDKSQIMETTVWLASLARNSGKPGLALHMLRKRSDRDFDEELTLDRVRGSGAVTQPCRVVWGIDIPDPTTPSLRRLVQLKNNFGEKPDPLGFTISNRGVMWTDAPEPPPKPSPLRDAKDFLFEILNDGPVPTNDVEEEADALGIAKTTLKRARRELKVASRKEDGAGGQWILSLPVSNFHVPSKKDEK